MWRDAKPNQRCGSGSITDEPPVTQRESFRRVRRLPVSLERLVDRQRRANTYCRRKKNLMKMMSNFLTYPTSCWNILLIRNESSFDCERIWAAYFDGGRRRGGDGLQWSPACLRLVCRPWSGCYKCSRKPCKEISARSSQGPPPSSTSGCDRFSPRL